MRIAEAGAQVGHERELLCERLRPPPRDQLCERIAGDVFHRHIQLVAVLPEVVNGDDVRVYEPPRDPGLPDETLAMARRTGIGTKQFDRDEAIELDVACEMDFAHPAPP